MWPPPILTQSIWRDEAFSLLAALRPTPEMLMILVRDQTPPLHTLLLQMTFLITGPSEYSARLLSLLLHLCSTIVFVLLLKQLALPRVAGIITAVSFLIHPFLLWYAFEARTYSLFILLTLLSLLLLYTKRLAFASVSLSFLLLTHNFAYFYVGLMCISWIWASRTSPRLWLNTLILCLMPLLTAVAWGIFASQQLGRITEGFWITERSPWMILHYIDTVLQGSISHPLSDLTIRAGYLVIGLAVLGILLARRFPRLLIDSLLLGCIPLLATYLISALYTPLYHERYLIASVPFVIIGIAYGMTQLWRFGVLARILVALSVLSFLPLMAYASFTVLTTPTKFDYRAVASSVLSQAEKGDVIVTRDALCHLEIEWYTRNNPKNVPVLVLAPDGTIVHFLGASVFDPMDIVRTIPNGVRAWVISCDGSVKLQEK